MIVDLSEYFIGYVINMPTQLFDVLHYNLSLKQIKSEKLMSNHFLEFRLNFIFLFFLALFSSSGHVKLVFCLASYS